jgi:hypothetical protein
MAAWTYSAWITQTDAAARLTMLRLHIQEVMDSVANPQSVNSSAHGMSRFDLQTYLGALLSREAAMAGASSSVGLATFRRAR